MFMRGAVKQHRVCQDMSACGILDNVNLKASILSTWAWMTDKRATKCCSLRIQENYFLALILKHFTLLP